MSSTLDYRKKAAIAEFRFILETYILPLLPTKGKLILKDEVSVSRNVGKHLKVYKRKPVLYMFPALETPQFHFRIDLEDQKPYLRAAEVILSEILRVSRFDYRVAHFPSIPYYEKDNLYRDNRFNLAFEYGLCMWLGGKSIFDLLQKLKEWSQKTYEGKHISFSFIIDASKRTKGEFNYIDFLGSNHSAVFTDGFSSGIKLDNFGRIVKYFSTTEKTENQTSNKIALVPYRFQEFADMCYSNKGGENWVGIIAQSTGDILIFKKRVLSFANRNGKWMQINPYRICKFIEEQISTSLDIDSRKMFSKEIYVSLLDVSFSRAGGCLAIIDEDCVEIVKRDYIFQDNLEKDDSVSDSKVIEKKNIIRKLISSGTQGMFFQYLDRKLRSDLLSLDGATVIDTCGRILSAGAIVKINGGSDGGGRTAATKQLAQYGMAMKISMDGKIECYRRGERLSETIDKIFTVL